MRAARLFAAALAATALLGGAALGKAPKAGEAPTVQELYEQAKKAIDDKVKADADKLKDPLREAIDAYRDRKVPLTEYQVLVDCLNNAKDDNVQPYRANAAQALVTRFSREVIEDPMTRTIRREIAKALLDLMKAPPKDDTGLRAIETILYAWWRSSMTMDIKFRAQDKLDERKKSWAKMKKYLEKGDN